jgi:dTDP-4-dehydrorhamnose reductase
MKKLCQEREELKVVSDQVGVPTSNQFIARQIQQIIPQLKENNVGIYHLVPDGSCSWYEFAQEIIHKTHPQFDLESLYPIQSHEFLTKTKRPKNSIFNNAKIKKSFNLTLNNWQSELEKIIDEA